MWIPRMRKSWLETEQELLLRLWLEPRRACSRGAILQQELGLAMMWVLLPVSRHSSVEPGVGRLLVVELGLERKWAEECKQALER